MKYICHCGKVSDRPTCKHHGLQKRQTTITNQGYGWKWQQTRKEYIRDHPTCEDCEQKGIVRLADEVHHIIPMADCAALAHDPSNLAALCRQCHGRRHGGHDFNREMRSTPESTLR